MIDLKTYEEVSYVRLCNRPISQFSISQGKIIFVPNGDRPDDLFIYQSSFEEPQILKFSQGVAKYELFDDFLGRYQHFLLYSSNYDSSIITRTWTVEKYQRLYASIFPKIFARLFQVISTKFLKFQDLSILFEFSANFSKL